MNIDPLYHSKCCFCAPLRPGLLVWAYFKLVFGIIILGIFLLGLFFSTFTFEDYLLLFLALYFITIVILLFDGIFNMVLVIGLHTKDTSKLRLYYRYGAAYVVVMIIYFLLSIGFSLKLSNDPNVKPFSSHITSVIGAIITFVLVLHCYLLILINSVIRKLKANP